MANHRGLRAAPLLFCALAWLVAPLAARAHSELVTATPADGSTVVGTPEEIVLTFTEPLTPSKSSITLKLTGGADVAKAGVDPANNKVMRLTPPTLQPGAYEVDWVTSAPDGDLARGTVKLTVTVPTPSPTVEPTATPSAAPSVAPSATPTVSPAPTPSPAASAAGTPTSASGTDVILPVVVAIVLIAVLGAWLLRGRMGSGQR
jgi:methionine-rich copper-binding protein CopC